MTLYSQAEEAIFGSPKDLANEPSPQEVANLFNFVPKSFSTVAALLADTATSYPTDSILIAGGFRYKVADSAASDHDVTTAGGVKLYVQPTESGSRHISAFGSVGSNSSDDAAAFQKAALKGSRILLDGATTYLVESQVTFATGTFFEAIGGRATIRTTATAALNVFSARSVNNVGIRGVDFSLPTGVSGYEVNGFHGYDIDGLTIEKSKISNGYHSTELSDITNLRLVGCESDSPYSFGFYIFDGLADAHIEDSYAHDSDQHDGFKIGGSDNTKEVRNVWITNCRSEDNTRDGLDIAHVNVEGVFISKFRTKGNTLKGIDLKMLGGGVKYENVWADNCQVTVTAGQVGASFITSDKTDIALVKDIGFVDMHFTSTSSTNTEAILLDSVTGATVSGGKFRGVKNAVRLNGTADATIKDLIVRDCQEPISLQASSGTGCTDTIISDVICDGTTLYDITTSGDDTGTIITDFRGDGEGGNGVNSGSDITFGPRVITKTSGTYQLRPQHDGSMCTDNGAAGNVEFQLPPGINGLTYYFISKGAALIKIDPDGSELISGGTAGQQLEGSGGATVTLKWMIDRWTIQAQEGSWSYA